MDSTFIATQFNETARMDLHQIAAVLVRGLGPTLVAAMTGTKDRKLPSKWAKPEGPNPSPAFAKRLLLGHRAWAALIAQESDGVARQWFIGGNPLLGEDTPVTAIREDRGRELIGAVEAFFAEEPDL